MSDEQPKAGRVFGAPVAYLQAHVGIMINHQSLSGIHATKHNCEMTLTPSGVVVVFAATPRQPTPKRYFVPFTNIESVELYD